MNKLYFKNNISRKTYSHFEFLLVLYIILVSKSLYYETYFQNLLLIPLLGFLIVVSIFNNLSLSKNHILFSIFITLVLVININVNYNALLQFIVKILISLIIASFIRFDNFSKAFVDVICLLALISLLYMPLIYFGIQSPLPSFISIDERVFSNFLFFGINENYYSDYKFINTGLFWEPGAYQVFLNLSIIFAIANNYMNIKKFFILGAAILSTFSTTGILVLLILILVYLRKSNKLRIKNYILYILIFSLLFFSFGETILNKILFESDRSFSFVSRYTDFLISLNLFLDYPIFGVGFGNLNIYDYEVVKNIISNQILKVEPTGADGITMFISQTGILGLIFLVPFLFPAYLRCFSISNRLLISISILLIFNTQNFTFLLIFNILLMYGLRVKTFRRNQIYF